MSETPPTLRETVDACLFNVHVATKEEQRARANSDKAGVSRYIAEQKHWRNYASYYRHLLDENPGMGDKPIQVGTWISTMAPKPKSEPRTEPDRRLPREEDEMEAPF